MTIRLLELLSLLQVRRHWTGQELAAKLETTPRTVRRDIDKLRSLGYRIDSSRGTEGGYRLAAGTGVPPLLLSDAEAVTVAIGVRLAAGHGLVDGEDTTVTALAKVEQILPARLRRRVSALTTHVRSPAGYTAPVVPDLLGEIALSCRDLERLRFHYVDAEGKESRRHVEPHSLVSLHGRWLLLCWDQGREDWRSFRVDRLSHLQRTGARVPARALPDGLTPEEFIRRRSGKPRADEPLEVLIDRPLPQVQAALGVWARQARVGPTPDTTWWPVYATDPRAIAQTLLWLPPELPYTLPQHPDLARVLAAMGRRLAAVTESGPAAQTLAGA